MSYLKIEEMTFSLKPCEHENVGIKDKLKRCFNPWLKEQPSIRQIISVDFDVMPGRNCYATITYVKECS